MMNTIKNIGKKSPKINKTLPPIDSMDTWGSFIPNFIEKRLWHKKRTWGILALTTLLTIYSFHKQFLINNKNHKLPQNTLSKLEQQTETIKLTFDTISFEEDENSSPNYQQEACIKLTNASTSVSQQEEDSNLKEKSSVTPQQIITWLHQQHIQGVAYKDFKSCVVVNGKIFHLNETIEPELHLVWSDIDPIAKKLFFYDANGISYFINY